MGMTSPLVYQPSLRSPFTKKNAKARGGVAMEHATTQSLVLCTAHAPLLYSPHTKLSLTTKPTCVKNQEQ